MKTNDRHFYHGAALGQIVEYGGFKALNKLDEKYGHYLVNTNQRVMVKYSTATDEWHFTFSEDDLEILKKDLEQPGKTFVCLVCGKSTICALTEDEFQKLISLDVIAQQYIDAWFPKGGSIRVHGTKGDLDHKIHHNAFPSILFKD